MQQKRRKIWIDKSQTMLMVRVAIYVVIMQATMVSTAFIVDLISNVWGSSFNAMGLVFLTAFFVGPALLFLYDALQQMHRIVGPLYRFRKTMQAIAAGEEVDLIRLRKQDYLTEFQEDMNRMLQALADRGAITLCATPSVVGTKPAEAVHSDAVSRQALTF